MPCALSAARWPPSALFPPQGRKKFHNAVLKEILDESVNSSRNRRNPRGVKRKMSNFPLRRGYRRSLLIDISAAIKIIKWRVLVLGENSHVFQKSQISPGGNWSGYVELNGGV